VIASLLAIVAFAQLGQIQLPQPVGYVNDFAHVLSAEAVARIDHIVQDVRAKSGGEIAVVTLPDLKGRDPSDVALQIGRQWKVGQMGGPGNRAKNAGVIILIVPKETSADGHGHTFIATGQGSEGFLTDATTGAIQDEAIPFLRERDYGRATELMTFRVAERFASEFGFALDTSVVTSAPTPEPVSGSGGGGGGGGINPIFIFILFFIVLSLLSRGRRRGCGCLPLFLPFPGGGWGRGGGGGWSGGGGGGFGGFGGFGGGGGFSGGGAGRSW
jgi:uncharacterized protein